MSVGPRGVHLHPPLPSFPAHQYPATTLKCLWPVCLMQAPHIVSQVHQYILKVKSRAGDLAQW